MNKKVFSLLFSIVMFFSSYTVCFAEQIYVGRDEYGSDFYFVPGSIDVLCKEKDKFIYTVVVREVLGNAAREKLRYSSYENELCYPIPANLATDILIKYRYKMTKKLECRQEIYALFDNNNNLLGADNQTKYYHDCYSPLMTFEIFYKASQYILDNKLLDK